MADNDVIEFLNAAWTTVIWEAFVGTGRLRLSSAILTSPLSFNRNHQFTTPAHLSQVAATHGMHSPGASLAPR